MRSIELFSGAGGLALGLGKAGFESAALVEREPNACATLRRNRPHWKVLESDVREIDFRSFGKIQLVAGGPPCQPFSMGGKAKGYDDQRDMFPQAIRAVRELKPRAFLFENVRGLLRPMFRNYVEFIRLQLKFPEFPISSNTDWDTNLQRLERFQTSSEAGSSLSYRVAIHLADAADYGVPQRRHRVFFVGFRADEDVRWFFPQATHSSDELLRSQWIRGDYWARHGLKRPPLTNPRLEKRIAGLATETLLADRHPWQTVRDAITDLDSPRTANPFADHRFQPGARSYPGHTGSPLDEPSKALKAGDHGVPGGENMLRHPNGKIRYFSVRESARIQTFPDDWIFRGSWTESMRQLGNAVPVDLAATVAQSIHRHLAACGRKSAHRQMCMT